MMRDLDQRVDPLDHHRHPENSLPCGKEFGGAEMTVFHLIQGMGLTSPKSAEAGGRTKSGQNWGLFNRYPLVMS